MALLDRAHGRRLHLGRASCPSTAPTATSRTPQGCETQFRAAFLLGCVGAWSLHPAQIEIAKKVFSPPPDEVLFAKKVIEAIPDGAGVHMIDGKMQDDATWKQCKVMVDLAEMLARKDPELAEAYELNGATRRRARRGEPAPERLPPPPAGPLPRVRPAGDRLQRQLPRLRRHRHHRALPARRSAPGHAGDGRGTAIDMVVAEAERPLPGPAALRRGVRPRARRVPRIGETSTTTRGGDGARRRGRSPRSSCGTWSSTSRRREQGADPGVAARPGSSRISA